MTETIRLIVPNSLRFKINSNHVTTTQEVLKGVCILVPPTSYLATDHTDPYVLSGLAVGADEDRGLIEP